MLVTKGRPNRLGIAGWVGGGRWGFERYLYTLHRVTGLALLAYFLMHIVVTTFRAFGPEAWERAMGTVSGPLFKIGEYLVDTEMKSDLDYQQSLILAMKKEKAAFRMYSDLASVAEDGDVKSLLLTLAQEEARHKLRFEVEYDEFILTEN